MSSILPHRPFIAALFFGAFVSLLSPVVAQTTFTINATATSTALGYTSGQSATFTYVLHNYSPTTPAGTATNGVSYVWQEETLTQPELFTGVSGTGLTGTWTRPNASGGAPASSLEAFSDNSLKLVAGRDTGTTGLTVNGQPLLTVSMYATFTGLTFSPITGTLPDPTSYFSSKYGTYTASSSWNAKVWDTTNASASFQINSITIGSAIPEPSTYAAVAGFLALGLALWRRRANA